jgi:Bifunctional DNA primase/polymerase, N-terminal/Primase C terminal 1 (PriCT-1)
MYGFAQPRQSSRRIDHCIVILKGMPVKGDARGNGTPLFAVANKSQPTPPHIFSTMTANIEQAALDYLGRHWSVIPIGAHSKTPAVRWLEFQHRLATAAEVNSWFQRWPNANVGIVTGVISGLVVLDIDPKHGGLTSLDALIREHGPLPHTIEAATGGGGRHLYFAHPGGIVRNKVGLAPGIDLRGDGGCIVAPPSIHASGKTYVWRQGHDPKHAKPAGMPRWLLHEPSDVQRHLGHSLEQWRMVLKEGVSEGERNNTITSLTGHLLWHEVDPEVAQELLLCWNRIRCRPPLSDEEVIRTVDSITRLHGRET